MKKYENFNFALNLYWICELCVMISFGKILKHIENKTKPIHNDEDSLKSNSENWPCNTVHRYLSPGRSMHCCCVVLTYKISHMKSMRANFKWSCWLFKPMATVKGELGWQQTTRQTAVNTFYICLARKKYALDNCLHTFHNLYYFPRSVVRKVISSISSRENPLVFHKVTTSTAKQREIQIREICFMK